MYEAVVAMPGNPPGAAVPELGTTQLCRLQYKAPVGNRGMLVSFCLCRRRVDIAARARKVIRSEVSRILARTLDASVEGSEPKLSLLFVWLGFPSAFSFDFGFYMAWSGFASF